MLIINTFFTLVLLYIVYRGIRFSLFRGSNLKTIAQKFDLLYDKGAPFLYNPTKEKVEAIGYETKSNSISGIVNNKKVLIYDICKYEQSTLRGVDKIIGEVWGRYMATFIQIDESIHYCGTISSGKGHGRGLFPTDLIEEILLSIKKGKSVDLKSFDNKTWRFLDYIQITSTFEERGKSF